MARSAIRFPSPMTLGGRVGLTLFMIVWMAIPSVILVFLGRQALEAARPFSWQETDCVIVESEVVEPEQRSDSRYSAGVKYLYRCQGQDFISDRISLKKKSSSDYRDAQKWVLRYPVGAKTICYVNPGSPDEAVLLRKTPWFLLIAVFPLGFIALGAAVLWGAWRGTKSAEKPDAGPLSAKSSEATGRGCLALFFSVFLLFGLGFSYVIFLRPTIRMLAAQNWQETPCVVLSSRVVTHSDGDGNTYSVDILYSYSFAGRELKANRYNFASGATSGRSAKDAIVRHYPAGRKTVCYVNPTDPTEAVLVREAISQWWPALIPLIFVVIGAGGIYVALRQRSQKGTGPIRVQAASSTLTPHGSTPAAATGPVLLGSTRSRLAKFIGGLFVAGFWNGIVSIFVWQAIQSFQRGRPEWFLTIFMIPFVLIGLVLLGYLGYAFLLLFAPGVKLQLSLPVVPLGDTAQLDWEINCRPSAIRKLRIWIEGREEATYRRGTTTSTDKFIFVKIEVASASLWTDIRHGHAQFTVPADSMHSFASKNNKIVWTIRVHGDIAMYPDVNDGFPLTVTPQKLVHAT